MTWITNILRHRSRILLYRLWPNKSWKNELRIKKFIPKIDESRFFTLDKRNNNKKNYSNYALGTKMNSNYWNEMRM